MFQTNVTQKMKTHFMFNSAFPTTVPFMR